MPEESLPLALIVNPSSAGGRALRALRPVEEQLDQLRIPFRVEVSRDAEHAAEEVASAARHGEIPVIMSGDGLVGMAGGLLANTDTPLAVIPCGRGNDFARALGIPTDPAGAVDLIASGQTRKIDLGEANGVPFLCVASIGFDSVANELANRTKLVKGSAVYAYAALRVLASWRPAKFRIQTPEGHSSFTGYSVAVANGPAYGGGMFIAPDARVDDGLFDLVTIAEVSKPRFLVNLPKVFKGSHVQRDEVSVSRARTVDISASRPFPVYADGEHITDLPVKMRVLPKALKVIAPGGDIQE